MPEIESGQQAVPARTPGKEEAITAVLGDAQTRVPDSVFKLMVASVRDYAIFALDPTGHVASWNAGAERIKGYRANEIIGRHFSVFYTAPDIESGKPAWELEVARAEGRIEDEGWRLRKDGTRFWASVIITALRDATGELIGFAKVTRDLTDRRNAEQALRRSEQQFRLIVQGVRDYGIFMLDRQGLIASWNEGAQRINGYEASEVIGRPFSIFYPEEDVRADKPAWELKVATRDGRFEEEGWRLRKNGTRFWASVVITALRNDDGELVGFGKVTRDLTERRAAQLQALEDARRLAAQETARSIAEQRSAELATLNARLGEIAAELERQRATAEQANRAKAQFLAAMSHELRTPLNAIGGYVDLLAMELRGPVTEQQRADLDRIRRSQQHLLGLINDILNFSRIDAGQVTYLLRDVPVHEVTDSVAAMIAPQAEAKGIEFSVTSEDPEGRLHADGAKVEQILLNLLSNAVKFTNEGGSVRLESSCANGRVVFRVVDSGIGIPPEQIESIFEPFVQVGRSLTSPSEGTGLGLAISRDLAIAMGGTLRAESRVGQGSVFTLTLPASPPSEPRAER